jgi:hypothetical protein
MLNRLLPIFLLIFSVFSLEAHARQVYNSIPERQDLIKQIQIRIQELSNTGGQRVSSTGAVFTRDTSVPALGEAYRDPSGLIWGSIVMAQGKVNWMNQYDADKYCKDGGARLPTKEEFEQLAKYLGIGTARGYSPYLADGKTDFLPGLSGYAFWSSSVLPSYSNHAYGYDGSNGGVYYDYRYNSFSGAVLCVAGR